MLETSVATASEDLYPSSPPAWPVFSGMNGLVAAATPLLLLLARLQTMPEPASVAELHRQTIVEIAGFEEQAKYKGCEPRLILAARYCLCTALDEMVLCTTWGSQSVWSQQTLLSLIQKETWGGERFFIILEKMAEEGQKNCDLLELLYIIMSLGYEGKYYNQDSMVRDEIRHRLFRIIQSFHPQRCYQLSLTKAAELKDNLSVKNRTPGSLIGLFTIVVLGLLWLGFNWQTYHQAKDSLYQLNQLGRQNPQAIFEQLHTKQHPTTSRKTA